ncbi:MAG: hypothetical protein LBB90_05640 [Tannerella sp.]|nr:hypothetical protein [Tannerella sp.]
MSTKLSAQCAFFVRAALRTACIAALVLAATVRPTAQITQRPRPAEWSRLVEGGRFMDRFMPMPPGRLSKDLWGAEGVVPRYVDNGIENDSVSFWGGNILKGEDGKFHLFVCGWPESSLKGHHEWPNSTVFHATGDRPYGPFTVRDTVGRGHNPEIFRLRDNRYVIYVMDGRYVSNRIDGGWTYSRFEFDPRGRRIIEGLSNLTFARREDGSFLMVCRGGGIWISENGLSPYRQLTDERVYPPVEGNFEDPVVWRDHIQYHLIVNDWLGRIAFYLRSKDGIHWVVDPGEAYLPGIARHEDGYVEDWFKFERIKIYQDEYGRAVQANFAVIDVLKNDDKKSDRHSSKNIAIPLNPGLLLTILDTEPLTPDTKTLRVKIAAEKGFHPHTDVDIASLRFGASTEVNFGRGAKALRSEKTDDGLIVTFDAAASRITDDEFAPKLIGKTTEGKLLYGYARLPWIDLPEPYLSALAPLFTARTDGFDLSIEVQNFGQVASRETSLKLTAENDGKTVNVGTVPVPPLKPYEKTNVRLFAPPLFEQGREYAFTLTILSGEKTVSTFHFRATPLKDWQ